MSEHDEKAKDVEVEEAVDTPEYTDKDHLHRQAEIKAAAEEHDRSREVYLESLKDDEERDAADRE